MQSLFLFHKPEADGFQSFRIVHPRDGVSVRPRDFLLIFDLWKSRVSLFPEFFFRHFELIVTVSGRRLPSSIGSAYLGRDLVGTQLPVRKRHYIVVDGNLICYRRVIVFPCNIKIFAV